MGSGKQAPNKVKRLSDAEIASQQRTGISNSDYLSKALEGYGSGGMSLEDALASAREGRGQFDGSKYDSAIAGYGTKKSALQKQIDALKKSTGSTLNDQRNTQSINRLMQQMGAYDKSISSQEKAKAAAAKQFQMGDEVLGSEFARQVATDPRTGTKYATSQVQDNPLLSEAFGEGGLLSRMGQEEQNLANTGFNLTNEDHTAYGQASGDIARMFGQQEQSLAQTLANRGLGTGKAGAAVSGFSGLQGNKYEQLGKAQMDIAQRRYQDNMQRLHQTRQQIMGLTGQGGQELANQYARNTGGAQLQYNQGQQQANNDFRQKGAEQDQANTGFQQEIQTAGPSLGDVLGGIGSGVVGGLTGGLGTAFGGAAGQAVFGKKDQYGNYGG